MITSIETYSEWRQSEVAMYSILDAFKKLDQKLEKAYTSKERSAVASNKKLELDKRHSAKNAERQAKSSEASGNAIGAHGHKQNALAYKQAADDLRRSSASLEKGLKNKQAEYKTGRNIALAGLAVAALAGIGYGAYKIAQKIKSSKEDPNKIMDEIKTLEAKAKEQGGLNKSDAEKLESLSKKLAKMAVKADPKVADQITRDVQKAEQSVK